MAELGKSEEVIVGAASVYVSNVLDTNTARPAFAAESYRETLQAVAWNPAITDGTNPAAWRPAGYTMEGLEVSYEPEYGDVEVDQVMDSVLTFKQSMRVSLNTTLAQATLYNLMLAWGQGPSTLTSSASDATLDIAAGQLGEAPVERGFIAVGNGSYLRNTQTNKAAYGERVYHAYRVLNVENSTHALRRSEATGIPVSFRALPANNSLYGKITDRKKTW